jgi:hypothetical protein
MTQVRILPSTLAHAPFSPFPEKVAPKGVRRAPILPTGYGAG